MNFANLNDDIVRDFNKVMGSYMGPGEAQAWLHVLNALVPVLRGQAEQEKPKADPKPAPVETAEVKKDSTVNNKTKNTK